jgi:hypothetical protein
VKRRGKLVRCLASTPVGESKAAATSMGSQAAEIGLLCAKTCGAMARCLFAVPPVARVNLAEATAGPCAGQDAYPTTGRRHSKPADRSQRAYPTRGPASSASSGWQNPRELGEEAIRFWICPVEAGMG